MDEVKSRAKWWNNEVVVPNLSTSFYMLSGPGALPRLRNLTIREEKEVVFVYL